MSKEVGSNTQGVEGLLVNFRGLDGLEAQRVLDAQIKSKKPRYISCTYLDEGGEWDVSTIYHCKNLKKTSDCERKDIQIEMQRADLVQIFDGDTV